MATKLCPDCAEQVRADAETCRHCGHDFSAAAAAETAAAPWPAALVAVGVVMAIVGLLAYSQGLTMLGLFVAALGGFIWRYRTKKAEGRR
jgi:hypothetical protein